MVVSGARGSALVPVDDPVLSLMARLPGPATSSRDNTRGNVSAEAETPLAHRALPDAMSVLRRQSYSPSTTLDGGVLNNLYRYFHCCLTSSHSARSAVTASWGSR